MNDECLTLRYWPGNWSLDADGSKPYVHFYFPRASMRLIFVHSLLESPVFDAVTGFGGNGVPGAYTLPVDPDGTNKFYIPSSFVGCVQDGPFASYVICLGPGKLITDHTSSESEPQA